MRERVEESPLNTIWRQRRRRLSGEVLCVYDVRYVQVHVSSRFFGGIFFADKSEKGGEQAWDTGFMPCGLV